MQPYLQLPSVLDWHPMRGRKKEQLFFGHSSTAICLHKNPLDWHHHTLHAPIGVHGESSRDQTVMEITSVGCKKMQVQQHKHENRTR